MNIGVFFGSKSPEHDVSIITGQLIIAELRKLNYQITPIYISKAGEWFIGNDLGYLKFFTNETALNTLSNSGLDKYNLDLKQSRGKIVFKKQKFFGQTITVDLAFPAVHGSYGEDGTLQGLLEMLNVPYVGCDVAASAIGMDKVLTKLIYQALNIPTTKFVYFTKIEWNKNKTELINKITNNLVWPIFVKPARLGSSIGIAKVKNKNNEDLKQKIEVALFYDDKILVEEGVNEVVDLTCALIGNEDIVASLVQESVFSSDLFDFEEKYINNGGAQTGKSERGLKIPANISPQITEKVQIMAKQIYQKFGCSGIARVDFLLDKQTGICYASELNTLPGTLYHHLWKKSGLELGDLLKKLINLAQERCGAKQKQSYAFKSNLLNHAGSIKLGGKISN